MSLNRVDPHRPFKGPHQDQPVQRRGPAPAEAKAAMIMIHGRGATAESILMLADEFFAPGVHFAGPQAFGNSWYPYSFLSPISRNQPGLNSGLQAVYDLIAKLETEGIHKRKILLLGFSQGACLATEFVARHPARFGGVIGLSGGLIGDSVSSDLYSGSLEGTPVFLGCSNIDPHIPVERVNESARILNDLDAEVTKEIYSGMAHTVNKDEIEQVNQIIREVLSIDRNPAGEN